MIVKKPKSELEEPVELIFLFRKKTLIQIFLDTPSNEPTTNFPIIFFVLFLKSFNAHLQKTRVLGYRV